MASTSDDARSVRLEVAIWAADDGHIHIASNDPDALDLHTTVNNTPGSKRYHPNAYRKLARILVAQGKEVPGWEPEGAGREAARAEEQGRGH